MSDEGVHLSPVGAVAAWTDPAPKTGREIE